MFPDAALDVIPAVEPISILPPLPSVNGIVPVTMEPDANLSFPPEFTMKLFAFVAEVNVALPVRDNVPPLFTFNEDPVLPPSPMPPTLDTVVTSVTSDPPIVMAEFVPNVIDPETVTAPFNAS